MAAKFGVGDHVGDTYPFTKLYYDPIILLPAPASPRARRRVGLQSDSASFFSGSDEAVHRSSLHRFSRSIRQNDIVSRKDVPFGVPKIKFHISTLFPKTQIFGKFSTSRQKGLNNSDARE